MTTMRKGAAARAVDDGDDDEEVDGVDTGE
jgi:hypothetical protein